jgi:hypothetical protein
MECQSSSIFKVDNTVAKVGIDTKAFATQVAVHKYTQVLIMVMRQKQVWLQ